MQAGDARDADHQRWAWRPRPSASRTAVRTPSPVSAAWKAAVA